MGTKIRILDFKFQISNLLTVYTSFYQQYIHYYLLYSISFKIVISWQKTGFFSISEDIFLYA